MGYDAMGPGLAGATKEMVMSYSLDAFEYRDFSELEPGTVFADERGRWYMAARLLGRNETMALRLDSGEHDNGIGDLIANVSERVFAVAKPYGTSIYVDDLFDLRRSTSGPFPGCIMLASPLAIFGFGHERRMIGLNGYEIDEGSVHRERARYLKWSVWLVDADRKKVGDSPLVSIDASQQ